MGAMGQGAEMPNPAPLCERVATQNGAECLKTQTMSQKSQPSFSPKTQHSKLPRQAKPTAERAFSVSAQSCADSIVHMPIPSQNRQELTPA